MKEAKLIHFSLNSANGPFSNKSDHASYSTVSCQESDRCGFYKAGACAAVGFGGACPYAEYRRKRGPTRRAASYSKFISEAKQQYQGVSCLNSPAGDSVHVVGDYVFLPLSYLKNFVNPLEINGLRHEKFVPMSELNAQLIVKLVNFKPLALLGGEIKSYQERHVPDMLRGLKELFPDLVREAVSIDPELAKRFEQTTSVGRKALLRTLKPNCGTFKVTHKADWVWDGEYLTSINYPASFTFTRFSEIKIKPLADEYVTVTSDEQVTSETIFKS